MARRNRTSPSATGRIQRAAVDPLPPAHVHRAPVPTEGPDRQTLIAYRHSVPCVTTLSGRQAHRASVAPRTNGRSRHGGVADGTSPAQLRPGRLAHRRPTRGGRCTTRSPARRSPASPRRASTSPRRCEHGRTVGGPALRELTFHQRAALLKALGGHLREHREELYAVSARTGATLFDSKFDVDGGIGVLLAYASKAKRELPNDTVYVDGAVEPLGRGGTFLGQHICTPLHGVAVQVNAFNFPVWGPLEKFAPAFLAGVPSVVKPASPTAFLTAEARRAHRRLRAAARGHAAARRGLGRRHVRPPHRPGPRLVHRLRVAPRRRCARTPRSSGTRCGSPRRPTR